MCVYVYIYIYTYTCVYIYIYPPSCIRRTRNYGVVTLVCSRVASLCAVLSCLCLQMFKHIIIITIIELVIVLLAVPLCYSYYCYVMYYVYVI